MTRGPKIALVTVAVIALLLIVGHIAFVRRDDQQAAAFRFAVNEPEEALRRITHAAESKGTLVGSGVGVTIPGRESANLGRTQWTISPDGTVRGVAPERRLVVLLTPKMSEGNVTWTCKLEPEREFLRSTCALIGQGAR